MPEGWRLVPVEPTPKQIGDGIRALMDAPDLGGIVEPYLPEVVDAYKAMLTSAPPAPVAAGWIRVEDRLPILAEENKKDGVKVWTWDGQFVAEDQFAQTYTEPCGPGRGLLYAGDWFVGDNLHRVTHWMPRVAPLPPSPEAEVRHDHP